MFRPQLSAPSKIRGGFELLELIFHDAIHNLRKTHGNAVFGLVMSIFQSVMIVLIMYVIFHILGVRSAAIRGDFMLYVMSGVFMFMTHVKTLAAVSSADSPASSMMMHAPMNPIVAISAAALASLYQQTLSAGVILFFYDAVFAQITIRDPVGVLGAQL